MSDPPLLLGCNRWPLLQARDLQPDVFMRERGGVFLIGRHVSYMEQVDSSQLKA